MQWTRGYQGHASNVYRGTFVLEQPFAYDESCFATELPGTELSDATLPASGEGFYYLVRGQNSCGSGSLNGTGSQTAALRDQLLPQVCQ